MDLKLNLATNVAYAILAAIVAVTLIVAVAQTLKLRYEYHQGHDLDTQVTGEWPVPPVPKQ